MSTSQRVLEILATRLGRLSMSQVREAGSLDREQVKSALRVLEGKGYAERLGHGYVKATAEGLKALQTGKRITPGPTGPQAFGQDGSTLRARLWRAVRLCRKGTVRDFLDLAERGHERAAQSNAKEYLNALVRSGHLARLAMGGVAEVPSTVPPTRYSLVNDSGPLAPQYDKRNHRVFDPNTQETFDVA